MSAARDQLDLAAMIAARLWDSPLGDVLQCMEPYAAERITTHLTIGLLKDVTAWLSEGSPSPSGD